MRRVQQRADAEMTPADRELLRIMARLREPPQTIKLVWIGDNGRPLPSAAPPELSPEQCYRPEHGWPVTVPHTRSDAYLSGLHALNIPSPYSPGDWHKEQTWWTARYWSRQNTPHRTPLWGPQGSIEAAPGTPNLRDARVGLGELAHPAALRSEVIHAATMPQAIVDIAWNELVQGGTGPDRHQVFRWTSAEDETAARRLAERVETQIRDDSLRERWCAWRTTALDGPDAFYDEEQWWNTRTPC